MKLGVFFLFIGIIALSLVLSIIGYEFDKNGKFVEIDRKDNVVNMCEIKFYGNDFVVNKDYHKKLISRQELLSKELSRKVIIHNTLITTYGLKYNEYSSVFDRVVILDDLFTN